MYMTNEKNPIPQNIRILDICLQILLCAITIGAVCLLYFRFGTPEKIIQRALEGYGFSSYAVELEKQGHTYILKNPPTYDGVILTDWEINSYGMTPISAFAISKDIPKQARVSATVTISQSKYDQIEEQAVKNGKTIDAYLNEMLYIQLEKAILESTLAG